MDLGKLAKLSEHRKCIECGMEFHTKKVGDEVVTAMHQHVDHMVVHQPTGEQWTEAYKKIRKSQGKDV